MVQKSLRQIVITSIAALCLLFSGCATGPNLGSHAIETMDEPVTIATDSPAYSLLQQAKQARQQGQNAAAGRLLERAITVSQANEAAILYREFGELRLAEGQARNAEGMFMRALRDAPANRSWQVEIWQLIQRSREQQGNPSGAAAAAERVKQLQGLIDS